MSCNFNSLSFAPNLVCQCMLRHKNHRKVTKPQDLIKIFMTLWTFTQTKFPLFTQLKFMCYALLLDEEIPNKCCHNLVHLGKVKVKLKICRRLELIHYR